MDDLTEMLKGTLEVCVLQIIGSEETYGYAVTRRLNDLDLVHVTKRASEKGPPRKFYRLNDAGRVRLGLFWEKWAYVSSRIDKLKEGGK